MKKFVRDLKEKDHVQSVFLVTEKNSGRDRNGKAFMSLTLSDSTGVVNGRMFEKAEQADANFELGDVVWIKGFVQIFQSRRQVIVNEIRKAQEKEFNMADLIANLAGDPREHMKALVSVVSTISNPFIRQLLSDTLSDASFVEKLLKAPAAKTIHHAYQGGLLEHVHSIVKLMEQIAEHYAFLDRDLLIFGAIYHDIGKTLEMDVTDGIHYTRTGRLVGHMALACEMIDRRGDEITDFPAELRDILKHIVLSHHGKLEYGSPKLPMLPEAMVVAAIDDLDSRLNTLFHFLKTEVDNVPAAESWSHYHPGFERHFYLDFFRRRVRS